MAASTIDQVGRLLRGRELQFRAVVITALCSYFLQLFGIWLHWALWAIALGTILPWIPLFTMKILWTSKHYGFMAIYLVIMILQAGHVGEHVVQMLQFIFIYDPKYSCFGFSWYGICGLAHGVFGELDRELVHFVWDGLILVACIVVRIHFRNTKNIWLTLAVVAAAIHQLEHCYLFGNYVFNNYFYNHGGYFLGVHILNGYAAQNGVMGHDGLLGSLTGLNGPINAILPARIPLHFIYNVLVLIPMVLAFRQQVRVIYDEWLAKALPQLSEEQLIAATAQSENVKFNAGQIIFRQGDPSDKFYIITKGQVDVLRMDNRTGQEMQVARLAEGQYFGEIGLLGRTERTATIKAVTEVECLALNREVFKSLMASSAEAYKDVDVVLRRRLTQLGALQGLAVRDSVNADPDTILKTRMIRDRLKLLQADDVSRILGHGAVSVSPPSPFGTPQPQLLQQQQAGVAVAERPVSQPIPAPAVATPPSDADATYVATPANRGYHRGALLVRTGPSAGLRFEINAPRIIVGRRSTDSIADVPLMQIDDARVSRQHLEIFARPDGLYARDLGSANGTWLNGRQLSGEPVRLEDRAEIHVSPDTMLNFRVN
ncbi:MAG TPA: cyclic nucleotide-binding domain-containing protein [Ktedonobacteraceae bacterium]|nr:cyclic nucleotide-binding domain-containing protein [Ktedonobacteraceae bacterium]